MSFHNNKLGVTVAVETAGSEYELLRQQQVVCDSCHDNSRQCVRYVMAIYRESQSPKQQWVDEHPVTRSVVDLLADRHDDNL